MPFSQQSYQGQGIVQQNVTPIGGQLIGEGLAAFGRGIGAGIEKAGQNMDAAKRMSGAADGMRKALVNLGMTSKEEANSMGFDALLAFSNQVPEMLRQKETKASGEFMSAWMNRPQTVQQEYTETQQVPDPSKESFIRSLASQVMQQGGKPEGSMPTDESLWAVSTAPRRVFDPSPYSQAMAGKAKQAQAAMGSIQSNQPSAKANLEKGKKDSMMDVTVTKTRDVPATPEDDARYLSDLIKTHPEAAPMAMKLMQGNQLSTSDMIALQRYNDDFSARTIPGLGTAPDLASAKEMRALQTAYENVDSGVNRLLEILDTPLKKTNLDLRQEAKTITQMLIGALRVPITGPGAFSDSERAMLESLVKNPTDIFSMTSTTRKALETVSKRIKDSRDSYARTIGLGDTSKAQQGLRIIRRDNRGNPILGQ